MSNQTQKQKAGVSDLLQLLEQIQKLPAAFLQTREGVAFVSLISGIALEAGGFSKAVFKLRENTFLDEATSEKLEKASSENAFCLSLSASNRSTLCELKPKLNVEFDIWPWKGLLIPEAFGKFDMPVAKLLIILGTMGMSAEFVKGVGGIVPG